MAGILTGSLAVLAEQNAQAAELVKLRYFGGLTVEESAEALRVSPDTIMRDWRLAKAWLLRELAGGA